MKRTFLLLLCALCLAAISSCAETVDTTVCDVLKDPASFDGKIVRVKGTVIAGFDEFAIKDESCGKDVNAIWLSYPEGTKAKSGPAAMVHFSLAKNSPTAVTAPSRVAVTLDKNKDFKQFDSLLATQHKSGTMCLGCVKYTVTATLTGRLDGSKTTGVKRDSNGKFVAADGFGNMNIYAARLVLQSVSDISSKEIDYSKTPTARDNSGPPKVSDPVAAAHSAAGAFAAGSSAAEQLERAAAVFGKPGEHNGVVMRFAVPNEVRPDEEGKGDSDSPDGLLFNCTFDMDHLEGEALSKAITHVGTHIADVREHGEVKPRDFEVHAWETVIYSVIATRQKALTLPGGFVAWNAAWTPDERNKMVNDALGAFVSSWEPFGH